MGNDTMADLAELVADQVPPALLPGIHGGDAPAPPLAQVQAIAEVVIPAPTSSSSSSSHRGSSSPDRTNDTSETSSLANDIVESKKGMMNIDWDGEIALPPAVDFGTHTAPASPPKVVVLTGVSGLLGGNLLKSLLANPSVEKVFCIATRRLKARLEANELLQNSRIKYFEGDLTDPRLGLSEKECLDVFSRADVVIHNGADTSHMKFYPEIKSANVDSTKQLIRYCSARKIPIHYVSTVGVALFGDFKSFPEISVAAHNPPTDGSQGYVAAKWVSERLLEQLQKQRGVPVYVHRPSTIIREGTDATNAAAQIDWMNGLIEYMRKTRAVPSLKNLRGALDLVYLKSATDSILAAVFENKNHGDVTYTHQVGDIVIPLDAMKTFVEKDTGARNVKVMPVEEWSRMAVAAGMNRGIAALIDGMDDPGQPHYPRMLKGTKGVGVAI